MRHRWKEEHDDVLRAVVDDLLHLRDALAGVREIWWGAVAAETMRRLGATDIGPHAARSHWEQLSRPHRRNALLDAQDALARLDHDATLSALPEPDEDGDAWERTARTVEEWERTVGEETQDGVTEVLRRLNALEARLVEELVSVVAVIREDVAVLRREWEGKP